MRARRRRGEGFTFVEILVALAVLTFGIIPLVWAIMGGTRQTRISLRQVQAANHASNLLEALRTFGFRKLVKMPRTMVQLRGNENRWQDYSAGLGLGLQGLDVPHDPQLGVIGPAGSGAVPGAAPALRPPVEDPGVFAEFEQRFFGSPSVVPELEKQFTRYFHLIKSGDGQYITVIVRVEWPARLVNTRTGESRVADRHVELRTVLADPYRGATS